MKDYSQISQLKDKNRNDVTLSQNGKFQEIQISQVRWHMPREQRQVNQLNSRPADIHYQVLVQTGLCSQKMSWARKIAQQLRALPVLQGDLS